MPGSVHFDLADIQKFASGYAGPYRSLTSSTTISTDDHLIFCDAAGGAFTVTLPDAADCPGSLFYLKKTEAGANAVTIDTDGGQIEGGASVTLAGGSRTARIIASNGSAYWVVANL